jgi:Fe2+ or Zn2+ uptake regulation protein
MATSINPAVLLREAGMRATPGRIALIKVLAQEPKPASVQLIERKLKGALNQVTLYRALEALTAAGIVSRVNLEHDHAHFELTAGRPHHHHAICRNCGHIADIELTHEHFPEKRIPGFARIERYSLELFGICTKCTA